MNPKNNAVLLLGGGHAHALALPILARKFPSDRKLILVSDSARAPYSGMVPGHIAGHYARDECFINLPRLAEKCGAEFISDRVTALDTDRRVARLEKNGETPFAILSINTGGVPRPKCMLPETDCAVKPVARFAEWLDEWKNESEAKVAIVGAGAGGIEVALALRFRAQGQGRKLQLISGRQRPAHFAGAAGVRPQSGFTSAGAQGHSGEVERGSGGKSAGRFEVCGRGDNGG